MFCKYCGAPNDSDAMFCSSCGKDISKTYSPAPVQQNAPPPVSPDVQVISLQQSESLGFG